MPLSTCNGPNDFFIPSDLIIPGENKEYINIHHDLLQNITIKRS
jgi:hypothetical protein